jgi:hypothetical protein
MLCALLGLLHTYSAFGSTFRVWGTPDKTVGVSVESNHLMTIVHNESYLSCFTGLNPVWLSTRMARYVSPTADHYILYPIPHPEAELPCEENEEKSDIPTRSPRSPRAPRAPRSPRSPRAPRAPRAPKPITRSSIRASPAALTITKLIEVLRLRSDRIRSRMANVADRLGTKDPKTLLVLLRDLHRLILEKAQTRQKLTQATLQRFARSPKAARPLSR